MLALSLSAAKMAKDSAPETLASGEYSRSEEEGSGWNGAKGGWREGKIGPLCVCVCGAGMVAASATKS